MMIRNSTIDDLDEIAGLEKACFPPSEAATKEEFKKRLMVYPNHFWLLFLDDKLVALADGFCSDEENLTDEMYDNADMHDENGNWQMIFGLITHPDYRNRGYACKLLNHLIEDAKNSSRSGVVLTCKRHMIDYYSKFGFADEGISESSHGGEVWNQMRLIFDKK